MTLHGDSQIREAADPLAKAPARDNPLQDQANTLRFDSQPGKVAVMEPTRDTQKIGDKPGSVDVAGYKAENQAMERIGGAIFRDSAAPHLERLKEADPAGNGAITSSGMKKYLADANAYNGPDKENRYPGQFVRSVDALSRGFDSPALKEFKDDKGNISRESFTSGVLGRQDKLAKLEAPQSVAAAAGQVEAPKPEAPKVEAPKVEAPKVEAPKPEAPKVEAPKPEAPKVEAPKPEADKFNPQLKDLTTVKAGEGPFQTAARLLSAENGKASHADIKALTKALKDQYIEDHGGKKNSIHSMRRGESLIDSPQKMAKVLARLHDPALQARLSAFSKKG